MNQVLNCLKGFFLPSAKINKSITEKQVTGNFKNCVIVMLFSNSPDQGLITVCTYSTWGCP